VLLLLLLLQAQLL